MIEEKNYYGNLCTEMYEILHAEAPQDELNFYLSYAEKGKKILEPLCGSGRFLVPFVEIAWGKSRSSWYYKIFSKREVWLYIYQLGLCVIIYRYWFV